MEIGLAAEKIVQLILPAAGVEAPRGAAEQRLPVVGRWAVGPGVGPAIPDRLGVGASGAALGEPSLTHRGGRIDMIDHTPEPETTGDRHPPLETPQTPPKRIAP